MQDTSFLCGEQPPPPAHFSISTTGGLGRAPSSPLVLVAEEGKEGGVGRRPKDML